MSRLMDPLRSRALLVGAGTFVHGAELDDLPTVAAGIEELHRLLTDPEHGGLAPEACRTIIDPGVPDDVDAELWRCVDEAEDTLLVYYSGHGIPSPDDGSLHLAVRGTQRRRLHATAIPSEWIRRALRESDALAKVVILDCCFSGRAIRTMSAGALAEEVAIAGSFVLTASEPNRRAVAPEGERFTAFTGAIIDVLSTGVPGAGVHLDLETVFRGVKTSLRERGFSEPQAERINEAAQLAISRNPAARRAPVTDLPGGLADLAVSPSGNERASAARALARIARGPSRHARAAAALLEDLAHDPDPVVSAAARPRRRRDATRVMAAEPDWFRTAVFYDIHVPAFLDTDADGVGDLAGVADKADYLEWLGVDAVVLSSLTPPEDPTDLIELVDALHERGMFVVCDRDVAADGVDAARTGLGIWVSGGGRGLMLDPFLGRYILMAIAREEHSPITEAIDPGLVSRIGPRGLFLRDRHALALDDLPRERADQLVSQYGSDPRAVTPEGLRRRLAPMLGGDQDAIKLAHVLVLTLPGSPVLYYGDEIGMGEDLELEDLDAIRAPMQWTGEPGAGFSIEELDALPVAPIDDAVFGYRAVSVESQRRTASSFLYWLRRLLALRARYPVFGLGGYRPVTTTDGKVLAFVREHADDIVLVVANLGRAVSVARLDLSTWEGRVPVEMLGSTEFAPIASDPYAVTLGGRDFYLLHLREERLDIA